MVLCTLSMLSNPRIGLFTSKVPIHTIVIDEASQIKISDYLPALRAFPSIQKLCFIGDDKQCKFCPYCYTGLFDDIDNLLVPPYGQESIEEIQSIFEISHLRSQALFLDMQCEFIQLWWNKLLLIYNKSGCLLKLGSSSLTACMMASFDQTPTME